MLKPRQVIAVLQQLGFIAIRQRRSHKQFRHADRRALGRGTRTLAASA
jgi:predicted RNA binding protein YcfA (HicA-like mRNA interferase family)